MLNVDKDGDETVVDFATCASDPVTCLDNEVAYQLVINGISLTTPDPFINLSNLDYWSSTPSATQAGLAWEFNFAGVLTVDNATLGGQTNAVWVYKMMIRLRLFRYRQPSGCLVAVCWDWSDSPGARK